MQAIEVFTEKMGRRPTDNEVAVLVRDSRPDKLVEVSSTEVKQRQLARLTPEETQTLTDTAKQAPAFDVPSSSCRSRSRRTIASC